MTIAEHFAAIKERLVGDPLITSFHISRERSTTMDGHLRVQAVLIDGSRLEFQPAAGQAGGGDDLEEAFGSWNQ